MKAYTYNTQTRLPVEFNKAMQDKGVTHAIQVNSNLAALLSPDEIKFIFSARPTFESTIRHGRSSRTSIVPVNKKEVTIIHETHSPGSHTYFVRHGMSKPSYSYKRSYQEAFVVRARVRMGESVFPGLSLDEAGPNRCFSDIPNFTEDEEFWENQILIP